MQDLIEITDVKFAAASTDDVESGLIGWVSCRLNGAVRIDGIALRRTREGKLTLSFPCRRDASDRQHFYVCPVDREARRSFERQIFRSLALFVEEGA